MIEILGKYLDYEITRNYLIAEFIKQLNLKYLLWGIFNVVLLVGFVVYCITRRDK